MPSPTFMARANAGRPDEGTGSDRRAPNRFRVSTGEAFVGGVLDAVPWIDEIGARLDSFVYGVDYNDRLQFNRDLLADAENQHGGAFFTGSLAGAMLPGLGVAGKGVKGMALAGAGYGALYGSGKADGDFEDRVLGGLVGGGTGALGGYLIGAVAMPAAKWAGGKLGGVFARGFTPKIDAGKLPRRLAAAAAEDVEGVAAREASKASGPLDPSTKLGTKLADDGAEELEQGAILTVKDLLGSPGEAAKTVAKRLGKLTPQEAEKVLRDIQKAEAAGDPLANVHYRSLLKIDLTDTKLDQEAVMRAAGIFEDAIEQLTAKAGERPRTVKGMDREVAERLKQGVTLGDLQDAFEKGQGSFVETRMAQHVMLTVAAKVVRLREELLPEVLKGTEGAREKLTEELTDAAHRMVFAKGIVSKAGRALGILSHGVKANLVDVADDAYELGTAELGQRVKAAISELGDDGLKDLISRVRTTTDADRLMQMLLDPEEAKAVSLWTRTVGSVSLWLRSNALTPATFWFNAAANGVHTALRGPWARALAIKNLRKAGQMDEALMLEIEDKLHKTIRWNAYKTGLRAMLNRVKWEFWGEVENVAKVGWGNGTVAAKAQLKRETMLSSGYTPQAMREFDDAPRLNYRNPVEKRGDGVLATLLFQAEKAAAVTANTLDAVGGAGMKLFTAAPDDMGREFMRIAEGHALSARYAFQEARRLGVPDDQLEDYVMNRAKELATMPTKDMLQKIEASLVSEGELVGDTAFLAQLPKMLDKEMDATLFMDGPQTTLGKRSASLLELDKIGLVFPYIRTPIRLFERGLVDYGPFGAMSKRVQAELAQPGAVGAMAKARVEIGMHVFNGGLVLGLAGALTATNGGYENSGNLDNGPPNALRLPGGGFIEYGRMDPFSLTVGLGAMIGQAWRDGYKAGTEYDQMAALEAAAGTAVLGAYDSILSKSYLKGLGDLLGAMNLSDPDQAINNAEKILQGAVGRFVPLGGVGRQFNDTFRSSAIESVGWVDNVLRSIPGAGWGLAPQVDALGDEVKSRQLGINFGSSETTEGEPLSPVKRKLRDLGIDITTIRKSDPDGFRLTSDELAEVRKIRGKEALNSQGLTMTEALEELFADPWFNALPSKDQKRAEVVDTMREFNKPAWEILMERKPSYAAKKTYHSALADYIAEGMARRDAERSAEADVAAEGLPLNAI